MGSGEAVLMLYLNDYDYSIDPKSDRLESLNHLVSLVFDTCDQIDVSPKFDGNLELD